jgi:hypothetical protein
LTFVVRRSWCVVGRASVPTSPSGPGLDGSLALPRPVPPRLRVAGLAAALAVLGLQASALGAPPAAADPGPGKASILAFLDGRAGYGANWSGEEIPNPKSPIPTKSQVSTPNPAPSPLHSPVVFRASDDRISMAGDDDEPAFLSSCLQAPRDPPGKPMRSSDEAEEGAEDPGFLARGLRDPWIAGIASLVLPGAGQFYNAAAPHGFALKGYDMGMYIHGGFHALVTGVAIFHQFRGMEVEYLGSGGPRVLDEHDGQTWRVVHVVNAVLAGATAFLEALWVNAAGRDYVTRMRMQAFFDPCERRAGVAVALAF